MTKRSLEKTLKQLREQARASCSLHEEGNTLLAELKRNLAEEKNSPFEDDPVLINWYEEMISDCKKALEPVTRTLYATGDELLKLLPAYEAVAGLRDLCNITGTDKAKANMLRNEYIAGQGAEPGRSMFVDLILYYDFEPEGDRMFQRAMRCY